MKWYYSAVREIDPNVYMVGENWTGNAEIQQTYNSGIDSLFAFGFAGPTGEFVNAVRACNSNGIVTSLMKYEAKTKDSNPNAINAYFLSNHDQIRSGNYMKTTGEAGIKMASALYMLIPGNSFVYYGEEIGLTQNSQAEGDEYKREPMIWDSDNLPDITVNGITSADESQAVYGGVKQQQENDYSILGFYKRVIKIKNQNPEISRGTITKEENFDDAGICAYYVEYEGDKLLIIHNLSDEENKDLEITENMLKNSVLRGDLVASNNSYSDSQIAYVTFSGTKLTLPRQSTAILKEGD